MSLRHPIRRKRLARSRACSVFRRASLVALAGIFLLSAFYAVASRRYHAMSVLAPGLDLLHTPGEQARRLQRLPENARLFLLGPPLTKDDGTWVQVALLYKPPHAVFEERLDGWVSLRGRNGRPTLKEENLLGQVLALRTFYKWALLSRLRTWMRASKIFQFLQVLVPIRADKAFHVLSMFLVSVALFFLGLLFLPFTAAKVLLFSFVVTNLLGLFNEIVDLFSGRGNFEKGDLAANALGSAGLLVSAAFWALLTKASTFRPRKGSADAQPGRQ